MFDIRLERLKQQYNGYWATRIVYQLEYAHALTKASEGQYDETVEKALASLDAGAQRYGAIPIELAQATEAMLTGLSQAAKRQRLICAAHAHIDMNWMWRWDETVSISLDTFRTMLALMKEYPEYKFSQSQASVYQIVETYAPEMLEEIRARVKEGRWEVTASTWVEADKNMPNGESQARHLLYTRRYLKRLLGLRDDQFKLDFEPDTFGHHANVPEILVSGGVKYYYHCRGDQDQVLYRWVAPSGRSIIVYREPLWYLGYIEPAMALYVPSFCQAHGMEVMLKVYGVGDHGGGPTRRDVQRILDMNRWPVFPTIQCGTFEDYFSQVELVADGLPVKTGELNMVFTGCFTSQSRIKRANRLIEASLGISETFASLAHLDGLPYPHASFEQAWRNTLFNQFHDIIPGSGVIDTREYALGLFQQSMALATSQKTRAYQALTRQAQAAPGPENGTISEGAGVGFGVEEFRLGQVSRGGGNTRLFHVFNPSPWTRKQVAELVVWDWDGDLARLSLQDETGKALRGQVLDAGFNDYWGHRYLRVLAEVELPACGYGTVVLKESDALLDNLAFPRDPRIEEPVELTLENEFIKATFDSQTCALIALVDKDSGEELVSPERPATFRRIQEDDKVMGTAWVVGRYMDVAPFDRAVQVVKYDRSGPLRQWLTFMAPSGSSKLNITVSLDAGSHGLEYAVDADWHELGRKGVGVPQLNFYLPVSYPCRAYHYEIPCGTIERKAMALDVPALSWGAAIPDEEGRPAVQLVTEGTYAFRGVDDALALTLIRSSFDPDPAPEIGMHKINFHVEVVNGSAKNWELTARATNATHHPDVYSEAGTIPSRRSLMALEEGNVAISGIKTPEDSQSKELIVRLYETEGEPTQVSLWFEQGPRQATWVDAHEQPVNGGPISLEGNHLKTSLEAFQLAALRLAF